MVVKIRVDSCLQYCEENRDFEKERGNIKNKLLERAEEKLRKVKLVTIEDT